MSTFRLLNIIITGVLGLVFLYSGFFVSTDYAIDCSYKTQFGIECVSCGFSRDFASFCHLDFGDKINPYSTGLFLFCFIQFVWRLFFSFKTSFKEQLLIRIDLSLTVLTFILLVGPYLIGYIEFVIAMANKV